MNNSSTKGKICTTCGNHFSPNTHAIEICPVCDDDRQYVNPAGQTWTNYEVLAKSHTVLFQPIAPNLYSLQVVPDFAIAQRAFLVLSDSGNILWDCIPFIDDASINYVKSLGGLSAIAISHPHYYSFMVPWAKAFDCPIYLHANDKQWIMYPDDRQVLWQGHRQELWDDICIINTGGHFDGSSLLYLPKHSNGTILSGDTLYVTRDQKRVTFMYSYPNNIPLGKQAIYQIQDRMKGIVFDKIYGAFDFASIETRGREMFDFSVTDYMQRISG